MFSKSFGYALRGVLVIVYLQDQKTRVHVDEIASHLSVPRFFMSKILKNLAKEGIVGSSKGPNGGFYVNEQTLSTTAYKILLITDGEGLFNNCALRLYDCDLQNPCPLHHQIFSIKSELKQLFETTTVKDLVHSQNKNFLASLASPFNYKKIIPA
jgi:Rrf2 family transcriptional regulator, iron-sulfur cluster assembly transcription factor